MVVSSWMTSTYAVFAHHAWDGCGNDMHLMEIDGVRHVALGHVLLR